MAMDVQLLSPIYDDLDSTLSNSISGRSITQANSTAFREGIVEINRTELLATLHACRQHECTNHALESAERVVCTELNSPFSETLETIVSHL